MTASAHPPAPRSLPAVLAEFAQMMAEEQDADALLARLGDYTTELLPVDGVGVLLKDGDGLTVATANSTPGRVVEQLEVELAEGPCTTALRTGEQVPVPDLTAARERFPRFVPRALEAGVHSIHALPMSVRSEPVGSLNVIALQPLHLSADEVAAGQLLADVAIAYIANARLLSASTQLAAQLQQALDTRVVLEQAKGIVSERHGLTLTAAFELLRNTARAERRKVHEVAQQILRGERDL